MDFFSFFFFTDFATLPGKHLFRAKVLEKREKFYVNCFCLHSEVFHDLVQQSKSIAHVNHVSV